MKDSELNGNKHCPNLICFVNAVSICCCC